ncbi:GNAT family N-acetyltransferase [Paenibacillus sp. 1001270B_150601_E10]|uniref:GNAT family N-acetyltransferase n=1 Tax=Paenibacillus sp. 1001270B_150601_E10 TaxID=2787079 RepID=UPI0018A06913|nr:GNAT family N-acetyltransferase [Paenibacillus sp. 1001270B_150601_E10]
MMIDSQEYDLNGMRYKIRSAIAGDARKLSKLRLQIDGETEHLDRERGEAYIDPLGFELLIQSDTERLRNLFLVVEVNDELVAYSRCEGNDLKRYSHKVEFGVCVRKDYWGFGIGKNLLQRSIEWADRSNILKMTLSVLETNHKAVELYKRYSFVVEGILRNDRVLAYGNYYNTIVMGRLNDKSI